MDVWDDIASALILGGLMLGMWLCAFVPGFDGWVKGKVLGNGSW